MSKKKKREENSCCCCMNECCCQNQCCCENQCCCNNNSCGTNDGWLSALIFLVVACGAGLLNNCNSFLIILVFLLCGSSIPGLTNGCGGGCGLFGF